MRRFKLSKTCKGSSGNRRPDGNVPNGISYQAISPKYALKGSHQPKNYTVFAVVLSFTIANSECLEGGIRRFRLKKFYESLKSVTNLKGNIPLMVVYGISQRKKNSWRSSWTNFQ